MTIQIAMDDSLKKSIMVFKGVEKKKTCGVK